MAESEVKEQKEEPKKIVHTYPLIRYSDMPDEMKTETMEMVVTACEKHSASNEAAARMIKNEMDKKLGPPFHVVVGEDFGFEISYECSTLLYMFFAGNLAIVIWKF